MFSLPAVIYLCKGEDGMIIESKGSEEEPFEFTTQEGITLLLYMIMEHAYLIGVQLLFLCVFFFFFFCSSAFNLCTSLFYAFSEQVPEGLERAIMTMKKGEQALVTVDAEYLCDYNNSKGNTANNKVLYYEVELVDFVKVSFSYSPMYCNLQILVS